MTWRDLWDILEVGDRESDSQNAMIPARRQTQTLGSALKECPRFRVNRCVGIKPATDRVSVAPYSWPSREPLSLRRVWSRVKSVLRRAMDGGSPPILRVLSRVNGPA